MFDILSLLEGNTVLNTRELRLLQLVFGGQGRWDKSATEVMVPSAELFGAQFWGGQGDKQVRLERWSFLGRGRATLNLPSTWNVN